MLRWLVLLAALAGCTPRVLLRYRLRAGERFFTEVHMVRMGRPRLEVVLRARTDAIGGRRLHSRLLTWTARADGVPLPPDEAPTLLQQEVTPDRRRVIAVGGGGADPVAIFAMGSTRLPAGSVSVGQSWQEQRSRAGDPTTTWLRETLVDVDGGTGVIAVRGVVRTALAPTATGGTRAVVSSITGERRVELANGWVGRTDVAVVTSVRNGTAGRETEESVERSRIVVRVSRIPSSADLSE